VRAASQAKSEFESKRKSDQSSKACDVPAIRHTANTKSWIRLNFIAGVGAPSDRLPAHQAVRQQ